MSADKWRPIGALPAPGQVGPVQPAPEPPKPTHYVSKRAHVIWQRMRLWYPNKLGEVIPTDYCALIDAASREQLTVVMSNMKTRHLTWPPTFPEFAVLFAEQKAHEHSIDWPTTLDTIITKLLQRGLITPEQAQRPFTYHGTGGIPGVPVNITSITVPAVGTATEKTFSVDEWLQR